MKNVLISSESSVDFFKRKVQLLNTLYDSDNRLNQKETEVLSTIMDYYWKGGQLDDFESLSAYMMETGVAPNKRLFSTHKTNISGKGWIKNSRKGVVLPRNLMYSPGAK